MQKRGWNKIKMTHMHTLSLIHVPSNNVTFATNCVTITWRSFPFTPLDNTHKGTLPPCRGSVRKQLPIELGAAIKVKTWKYKYHHEWKLMSNLVALMLGSGSLCSTVIYKLHACCKSQCKGEISQQTMRKVYFLICKWDLGSSGGYGHLADPSTWRAKAFCRTG